jgi:acetyl esterase/lipase
MAAPLALGVEEELHLVDACADFLVRRGIAAPGRIAVSGRSYGGYLTLAALVSFPDVFAAGVDIWGVSDLRTFFDDTEPWLAAAVSKYGDTTEDRDLLRGAVTPAPGRPDPGPGPRRPRRARHQACPSASPTGAWAPSTASGGPSATSSSPVRATVTGERPRASPSSRRWWRSCAEQRDW